MKVNAKLLFEKYALGRFGFPVMCALDTITIGERPRTAANDTFAH